MSDSEKAGQMVEQKHSDDRVILSSNSSKGEWTIVCPDCNTIHRSAARLCPLCVQKQVHELQCRNRSLIDQNDRLRDFIQVMRQELFKQWHEQAVKEGNKSPLMYTERRWSRFLKTTHF